MAYQGQSMTIHGPLAPISKGLVITALFMHAMFTCLVKFYIQQVYCLQTGDIQSVPSKV